MFESQAGERIKLNDVIMKFVPKLLESGRLEKEFQGNKVAMCVSDGVLTI
jgi:hypothetical protein